MSPARPSAIHSGKLASSGNSPIPAIPHRSKPRSLAAVLARLEMAVKFIEETTVILTATRETLLQTSVVSECKLRLPACQYSRRRCSTRIGFNGDSCQEVLGSERVPQQLRNGDSCAAGSCKGVPRLP